MPAYPNDPPLPQSEFSRDPEPYVKPEPLAPPSIKQASLARELEDPERYQ